jgi:hypothetical protein
VRRSIVAMLGVECTDIKLYCMWVVKPKCNGNLSNHCQSVFRCRKRENAGGSKSKGIKFHVSHFELFLSP